MTAKATVAVAEAPKANRSVSIEMADNGYIVRIRDENFNEIQLVFTTQASMIKVVKEATTIETKEEKE
jgi:hypothetical protein